MEYIILFFDEVEFQVPFAVNLKGNRPAMIGCRLIWIE